jgi:hypothetical protein
MGVCGHPADSLRIYLDQQAAPDRCFNTCRGLDRPPATDRRTTVSYSIHHPSTQLLTLVGAIRRIAYDITLEAGDAMRRIRDLYAEYDAARVVN